MIEVAEVKPGDAVIVHVPTNGPVHGIVKSTKALGAFVEGGFYTANTHTQFFLWADIELL